MCSKQDIVDKVKAAMDLSCFDTFLFSEDVTKLIESEYLFTINTVKEIIKLNKYIGSPYKINLETRTKKFSSDCVPLFGKIKSSNFMGYKSIMRKLKNTTRNGKIDITIYNKGGMFGIPLCAIELKGFNPQKTPVIKDLKRNAEYFLLSSKTGKSQIEFTIFASLHSFNDTHDRKGAERDIGKLRLKYRKWLSKVGVHKSIEVDLDISTRASNFINEQELPSDEGYLDFENYHFVGVIIVFYKKI